MPEGWSVTCGQVSALGHAAVGAILIWVAWSASRAMITSGPELLLRAMSGSMVLLQLGSVLMFMARVTTRGHRSHAC